MKNFKQLMGAMAIIALLFTSCSKEEVSGTDNSENATLSFGALVNDLVANNSGNRQAIGDFPACSNDAPAYVRIVLNRNGSNIVGTTANPYRVNLAPGQIFTVEDPSLQLTPGTYTLEYFSVYNANGEIIWLAPRGGSMAAFVDSSLPLTINLGAGVKKYVDVDVLCYDNRDVREYGYLFFDIDTNEAIKFCIFGNVCPPSGRHYPAEYSVNIWSGNSSSGAVLYSNVHNVTGTYNNGDFYAEPLCFALPDTEGLDEYYFEITIRSSDEYGDVEERVIRRGTINDDIVRTFFNEDDGTMEYYHFREGCDGDDNVPIFETPGSDELYYKTCAFPMNGTNSIALAYFQIKDNSLKATILAAGVTPNRAHPQHIHGKDDNSNSTCPPAAADTNGDGLISIAEGLPYYGGVKLPLNYADGTFPVADANGFYTYQRTFDISGLTINNWEDLSVVVHGRIVDGEYVASLPVACGQVANLN